MDRTLLWIAAFGLAAWAVWLWPDVPARLPTLVDAAGRPLAWSERAASAWFGLPLAGLALAAVVDGTTRWMLRHPASPWLNLPNKDAILALPRTRRAPVLLRVASMAYAVGTLSLLALALIQQGLWEEAHGRSGAGWMLGGGIAAVAGPLAALVAGLLRVDAEVRRQQAAGRA